MVGLVWASSASAIPAFSRKYEKTCAACHYAWPQLNKAGRKFKEAGYRFPTDKKRAQVVSDFLYLDKHFPVSSVLVARPYDKKESGDKKIRAIHEIELIIAGVIGKQWSGFFEIEAEDETDFEPEIKNGILSYHHNKAVNAQFVWGPYLWADPYGLLGDHFRMTRGHVKAIDESFGGADDNGRLRSNRQMLGLYGRPMDKLFYNVGYSGIADDAEGEEAQNLHGRIAFDVTNDIMIGAFAISGENDTSGREFTRTGIDAQADIGAARIQAVYISADDDNAAGTAEESNNAFSLQGMYAFRSNRRPTFVPLVRYDSYERNDGADEYDELTLNLSYYFTENVKGHIEYWKQLEVPTGKDEDSRVTVQVYVAF
jgi:hypothetical protein